MKKELIVAGIAIIVILCFCSNKVESFDKYSNAKVNDVPITKTLAAKLQKCQPYSASYSDALFNQAWTNSLGVSYHFSIKGKKGDSCVVETYTKKYIITEDKERYEIPMGLAKHTGDIFYFSVTDVQRAKYMLKDFGKCTYSYVPPLDSSGYFNLTISNLLDYWKKWNYPARSKEENRYFSERKNDKDICETWRDSINKVVLTTPNFAELPPEKINNMVKLQNLCPKCKIPEHAYSYSTNDAPHRKTGLVTYEHNDTFCAIRYSYYSGVKDYNFGQNDPYNPELPKKCW